MYVVGEDLLANTSEDWTLVDGKKRRREGKKQAQKKGSCAPYKMKDRPCWGRERGWRTDKARERPHQRACPFEQAAVLVESTKHLDDFKDGWAVPSAGLQGSMHRPARDAAPAHSTDDFSGWDVHPEDLDDSSGWDVPPEDSTGWDL